MRKIKQPIYQRFVQFWKKRLPLSAPVSWDPLLGAVALHVEPISRLFYEDDTGGQKLEHHNILHTLRAAILGRVAERLYSEFSPSFVFESDKQTRQECIVLMMVSLLIHDSARLDDKVDRWDRESGANVYTYLTQQMDIDAETATCFAEAVANKDYLSTTKTAEPYFHMQVSSAGEVIWDEDDNPVILTGLQRNLTQVIQFGDCLDIIRARDGFDPTYLSFFQDIAADNAVAFEVLANLICEARGLIEDHGNSRNQADKQKQDRLLSNPHKMEGVLADIEARSDAYPELCRLLAKPEPFATRLPRLDTPETRLNTWMAAGQVFARTVPYGPFIDNTLFGAVETKGGIETRKAYCRPSKESGSANGRSGNPNRSVTMIGWGAALYAPAGFGVLNPAIQDFGQLRTKDCNTGRGKKRYERPASDVRSLLSQKAEVLHHLKMGKGTAVQNESELTLKAFDFVLYTPDPTCFNGEMAVGRQSMGAPTHPSAPLLEAIYLQQDLAQQTGVVLPIYEYSNMHNRLTEVAPTQADIVQAWVDVTRQFLRTQLDEGEDVIQLPLQALKLSAVFKDRCYAVMKMGDFLTKGQTPDLLYSDDLRQRVDAAIQHCRRDVFEAYRGDVCQSFFRPETEALDAHPVFAHRFPVQASPTVDASYFENAIVHTQLAPEEIDLLRFRISETIAFYDEEAHNHLHFSNLIAMCKKADVLDTHLDWIKDRFSKTLVSDCVQSAFIPENCYFKDTLSAIEACPDLLDAAIAVASDRVVTTHLGFNGNPKILEFAEILGFTSRLLPIIRAKVEGVTVTNNQVSTYARFCAITGCLTEKLPMLVSLLQSGPTPFTQLLSVADEIRKSGISDYDGQFKNMASELVGTKPFHFFELNLIQTYFEKFQWTMPESMGVRLFALGTEKYFHELPMRVHGDRLKFAAFVQASSPYPCDSVTAAVVQDAENLVCQGDVLSVFRLEDVFRPFYQKELPFSTLPVQAFRVWVQKVAEKAELLSADDLGRMRRKMEGLITQFLPSFSLEDLDTLSMDCCHFGQVFNFEPLDLFRLFIENSNLTVAGSRKKGARKHPGKTLFPHQKRAKSLQEYLGSKVA